MKTILISGKIFIMGIILSGCTTVTRTTFINANLPAPVGVYAPVAAVPVVPMVPVVPVAPVSYVGLRVGDWYGGSQSYYTSTVVNYGF